MAWPPRETEPWPSCHNTACDYVTMPSRQWQAIPADMRKYLLEEKKIRRRGGRRLCHTCYGDYRRKGREMPPRTARNYKGGRPKLPDSELQRLRRLVGVS